MLRGLSSGLVRQYSTGLAMLQRLLDIAIIAFGMMFATLLRDITVDKNYLLLAALGSLLFLLFGEINSVYRSWRTEKLLDELSNVVVAWISVVVSLALIGFATKTTFEYSRVVLSVWAITVPVGLGMARLFYRQVLRNFRVKGRNSRTIAFAGCTNAALKMAAHIKGIPDMGLHVLGVFEDRSITRVELGDLSFGGSLQRLVKHARAGEIDIVYVTLPMHAERRIVQLVNQLSDTTASVFVVPDIFIFDLFHAKWASVAGLPVVSVYESPFYGIDGWIKRAEDVVIGGLILAAIFPLMLLIGLGVRLTSPGPVLFKQRRYGLRGEVVEVWKFRSMTACDNGTTVVQATENDTRITPLGAFLRRTSLDELPQFINVLHGSMSIVGPRPHAVAHNEQYRKLIRGYMLRHKVKPGITGWAQVNGWRGETDTLDKMQKRVEHDLTYVRNWSLWFDMKIIFMTIFKGFVGKNVY